MKKNDENRSKKSEEDRLNKIKHESDKRQIEEGRRLQEQSGR